METWQMYVILEIAQRLILPRLCKSEHDEFVELF